MAGLARRWRRPVGGSSRGPAGARPDRHRPGAAVPETAEDLAGIRGAGSPRGAQVSRTAGARWSRRASRRSGCGRRRSGCSTRRTIPPERSSARWRWRPRDSSGRAEAAAAIAGREPDMGRRRRPRRRRSLDGGRPAAARRSVLGNGDWDAGLAELGGAGGRRARRRVVRGDPTIRRPHTRRDRGVFAAVPGRPRDHPRRAPPSPQRDPARGAVAAFATRLEAKRDLTDAGSADPTARSYARRTAAPSPSPSRSRPPSRDRAGASHGVPPAAASPSPARTLGARRGSASSKTKPVPVPGCLVRSMTVSARPPVRRTTGGVP